MTQHDMRNPFEHHHPHHDHDHDHGPEAMQDLDPAQQSLADALRVCFFLLKLVMLGLVVIYLFSGLFNVDQQERAVRLFFGQIVGQEGQQVLEPGGPYIAAPYPIMQVIRIPTAEQDLVIDKAFWYEATPQAQTPGMAQPLNPEKDGSLLTGDANIVHVQWRLTYSVSGSGALDFVRNVGSREKAEQLVRAAVEEAVVKAIGQISADEVYGGNINREAAMRFAQQTLDDLETGIELRTLTREQQAFPLPVKDAFDAVTTADSRRAREITAAMQRRTEILQEAAGAAYEALWTIVHGYEQALQAGDTEAIEQLGARLDQAFDSLKVEDPETGELRQIGGRVATMMYEAGSYRANIVQQVSSEAATFQTLREQWRTNRPVLEATYLAQARQEILANARETFWMPRGQVYLELNRDPAIEKALEQRRLEAEEQARQRAQQAGQR